LQAEEQVAGMQMSMTVMGGGQGHATSSKGEPDEPKLVVQSKAVAFFAI
jgi:hypothetical protein